jgi:lipoteichoic acid synthase
VDDAAGAGSLVTPRLRVGPALACAVVGLGRSIWLAGELSGYDVRDVGYLLLADLPVFGVLLLLAWLESVSARRWKAVPLAASVVVVAVYLVDVFTVVDLNNRLQLADIARFGNETWVVPGFLSVRRVLIAVAAAGAFAVAVALPPAIVRFTIAGALACLLGPSLVASSAIPVHVQKYASSVLRLPLELVSGPRMPVVEYGPADIVAYRAGYEALFDAPITRTRRDIVLVVVESLSAVDSERTSGIGRLLPGFDALSRRGTLFRNFFANNDASEGGIVALLSGVPPLHYPGASTMPFDEYGMQRTMTDVFRAAGYHTEFMTSVPLRFLSMHRDLQQPRSGFARVAGQQEIARFEGAPRFAFESPADHLLLEELLARLDARPAGGAPVLLTAVTASSHAPYLDPRGGASTEANIWRYVQDELSWLYEELARRDFFARGLLVVTGDHRKMRPVGRRELERYGESAKARVPLLVIGAGVPVDALDDRLFQQSDLLRMLDGAMQPGRPLSRHAIWVNRYTVVLGRAANAANVELFLEGSEREAYELRLRGADIEWTRRPPEPLPVEREIHRQRAIQQAARAAAVPATPLAFGRELTPVPDARGVLLTLSDDLDLGRDPDDLRQSRGASVASFDRASLAALMAKKPQSIAVRAFLAVPADGEYWFSVWGDEEICLALDGRIVLGRQRGFNSGLAILRAGLRRLDLRFVMRDPSQRFELKWQPPGRKDFEALPDGALILPAAR